MLSVPRVLDAFCKTWDWPASESSASSGSLISSRYTSFALAPDESNAAGSENRTPLYWLATTVSPLRINLVTTLVFLGLNELTLSLVPLSVVYWERCFDSLPLTTVVVRLFILSPTIRVLKGFINQSEIFLKFPVIFVAHLRRIWFHKKEYFFLYNILFLDYRLLLFHNLQNHHYKSYSVVFLDILSNNINHL